MQWRFENCPGSNQKSSKKLLGKTNSNFDSEKTIWKKMQITTPEIISARSVIYKFL
jgi:hypothetical protein